MMQQSCFELVTLGLTEEWEKHIVSKHKKILFQVRVTFFYYIGKLVFECHLK